MPREQSGVSVFRRPSWTYFPPCTEGQCRADPSAADASKASIANCPFSATSRSPGWVPYVSDLETDIIISMALDAKHTVRQCSSCTRERIMLRKHATYLSRFRPQAPLEHVEIDILGPLLKTSDGHWYVLCITDRCSKMVRTIPLKNITAATVAKAFCEHWVFHNGLPAHFLSENRGQFTAKFLLEVCAIPGIRKLFTTACHPQTNTQVGRFNRTILSGLRHFCPDALVRYTSNSIFSCSRQPLTRTTSLTKTAAHRGSARSCS